MLSELYTHDELAHARREQQLERQRVRQKFAQWSRGMENYFYRKRQLPKHWLPQSDRHSGHTYYFNLKTGAISQVHPLQEAVEEVRRQQQQAAERLLAERIDALKEYEHRLQAGLEAQRTAKLEQLRQAKRR